MKKSLLKTIIVAAMFATTTGANAQKTLYGWGSKSWGALGDGATFGNASSPTQIGTANWKTVGGGLGFSVGIQSDGTLWSWGQNGSDYQLGDGTTTDRTTPVQISTNTDWKTLSIGVSHTLLIKNDHTLWGFGNGNSGAFGTGTSANLTTPTQIGGGTADWEDVAGGNNFTLALKTNGTLWGWGKNGYKQLGNNDNSDVYSPMQIGTDTDWKMIAASESGNSFAIKTDGTLWAWGGNSLGGGAAIGTATQVGTATDWKFIASGVDKSYFAIKTDGTLWAWGYNLNGQLGIGNNDYTIATITQVGTDTDWESVVAGGSMAIMMKTNHTIWGAGQAFFNGIDPVANTNVPLQIGTDNLWTFITAGSTQSFALKGSTTGIQDNATFANSISLYPNPANDFVTITNLPKGSTISILDVTGKSVYSSTVTNEQTTINTANLTTGIYLIRIDNNGNRTSRKLVINK